MNMWDWKPLHRLLVFQNLARLQDLVCPLREKLRSRRLHLHRRMRCGGFLGNLRLQDLLVLHPRDLR